MLVIYQESLHDAQSTKYIKIVSHIVSTLLGYTETTVKPWLTSDPANEFFG